MRHAALISKLATICSSTFFMSLKKNTVRFVKLRKARVKPRMIYLLTKIIAQSNIKAQHLVHGLIGLIEGRELFINYL